MRKPSSLLEGSSDEDSWGKAEKLEIEERDGERDGDKDVATCTAPHAR
jgi:hypothetical protein